ncbi:MAG TPA: asparagine synthase (glutamine-hydrolyzing) [Bryobacteraceae bacterium]|nr:asparagine synthase (glutamine-hydrolyzing) [Bryobacteraceae bacterium]
MCGICGFVNFTGPGEAGLLPAMISAIHHRGPDDTGFYRCAQAGLGHARLSIIDVEGGRQPMCNSDGTLWITFNGEIFNHVELREELSGRGHRFRTRSDTEVILHLYQEEGERCVERLNGQWAFGIWDARASKLFLSRDRMGVRPLFYTRTSDQFLFGSEIKALLACPQVTRELDLQALDQIFTFWFALPPRTAFRNIHQLPPGHSLTLQNGEVRIWRHWTLEFPAEEEFPEDAVDRLAEEFLALLTDATRIRLRSDVPVGAYLSGGLDSTIIAALARKAAGRRLRTFSVQFDDPAYDETPFQREASRFLGTDHSAAQCTGQDIARVFVDVVRHAEQPLLRAAPAPMFLLSKLVHDSGFKVVLTGEGADEMMGGYDIFKEAKIRRFWARDADSSLRPLLLRRLYPYLDDLQRQPPQYLKRFFHVTAADRASPFFSHLPRWELTAKLKTFLSAEARRAASPDCLLPELERTLSASYHGWRPFHQAEYLEAAYLLPEYILSSQGDRMAMAHAVESRYPFLDHRVVEFTARLSPRLKMKVLDEKHLLRRAAAGIVPEIIRKRRKMPYRAPDGKSFFSSKNELVDDLLSPDQIQRDGVFDSRSVNALVAKFKSGRATGAKDNMALLGILSTEILLKHLMQHQTASRSRERTNNYADSGTNTSVHRGELSLRTL